MSSSEYESSPKEKKRKIKYNQKYTKEWEAQFEWVAAGRTKSEAHCKICNKTIIVSSGKIQLIRHGNSQGHISSAKAVVKQTKISSLFSTSKKSDGAPRKADLYIAAFIAEHNLPFAIADHLPNLIKAVCTDSDIAIEIKCGKTKATAIVKNVIGLQQHEILCDNLRRYKFSLIVDESTDLGCTKHLCLVARYFSGKKVQDDFLTLIQLKEATAEKIYNHIVHFFKCSKIPYQQNMIGLACDGANVMAGVRNSVVTKFKNDVPNLYFFKCICHSFNLCACYACAKLPSEIEQFCRDVCNHFANSPKRVALLQDFQSFCRAKPHKILHPAQTRWLSLESVVCRLIEQFNALKLYFIDASTVDNFIKATTILERMNDPITYLYLLFLEHALSIFTNLNREMQSTTPQIHKLFNRVKSLYKTLLDFFIKKSVLQSIPLSEIDVKNGENFKDINNIYLGAKVTAYLLQVNINTEDLHKFRYTCLQFYIEGAEQIKQRFNFNCKILQHLTLIDPEVIFNTDEESIVPLLQEFPNLVTSENIQKIDTEWRLLRNSEFKLNKEETIEKFWLEVDSQKCGDGNGVYSNLTAFVFSVLCLPHSSANVERVFSQINLMKTKQRNCLSTASIIGLLHTKNYITEECFNIKIDSDILSKHNNTMYSKSEYFSDSD